MRCNFVLECGAQLRCAQMSISHNTVYHHRIVSNRLGDKRMHTMGLEPKMLFTQPPKMASSGGAVASVGPVRSVQLVCQMRGKPARAAATRVVAATTRVGRRGALASARACALSAPVPVLTPSELASRSSRARQTQPEEEVDADGDADADAVRVSSSQQSPSASSPEANPPYSSRVQPTGRFGLVCSRSRSRSSVSSSRSSSCETSVSVAHERADGPKLLSK